MPSKPFIVDMEIANRFAIVRKTLKLNQENMALACNIDQTLVSRIEKGKRDLPVHAIKSLFITNKVSPLFIVAGIEPIQLK